MRDWRAAGLALDRPGPVSLHVFVVTGLIASWTYLRFFKKLPDGTFGDRRGDFEFASLFPEPLR